MKPLDEILKDPQAHGVMPSEQEVASWNEQVLRRWSKEQAPAGLRGFTSRPVGGVLFWGCLAFGAVVLGSLLWDSRGSSMEDLQAATLDAPTSILGSLATYPWIMTGIAVGFAVAVTRPLREFLLQQLD